MNSTPKTPAATPRTTNAGRLAKGGAAATETWNSGLCPVNQRATTSAVTAAMNDAVKTVGVKSRWTSSSTKTIPASGALKAAAKPAPAPAASSVRRSRGVVRNHSLTICPTAPPIWMVGPSRPRARPAPMPRSPSTNFVGRTRYQTMGRRWWSTALMCGMPLPAASGATRRTRSTESPANIVANTIGSTIPHDACPCA